MAGPDFAQIPRTIALLDNHSRRVILETLAMQPLTPGQLLRYVSVKQPTLTYHLQLLHEARLIVQDWEEPGLHVNADQVMLLARYAEQVLTPAGARFRSIF